MALQRLMVTDFSFGQVSKRFAGRIMSEVRTRAVQEAVGFVLHPDGGIGRRRGTIYIRDGLGIEPTTNRLYDTDGTPAFAVFRAGSERWLGYVQDDPRAWVAEHMGGTATMSIADASLEAGSPLQSHGSFYDEETGADYVHLWTEDDSFLIDLTTLTSLTRLTALDMTVAHQNRLIGISRTDGKVQMSKVLDMLDFTDDDDLNRPLTAIPDFAGIETPRWIVARQSVYVGTDEAEYEIYSSFPFFSEELGGVMIRRITEIGAEQACYLGPSLAVRDVSQVMLIQYGGEGFTYQAAGLTDRIDNNRIVQIDSVEFGTHRYLVMLDVDGVLWLYLASPASGVDGWVVLAEDVGWVWCYNKDIYAAIERDDDYTVEIFPLDELQHPGSRTKRQAAMFYANDARGDRGGYLTLAAAALTGDTLPPSTMCSLYEIDLAEMQSRFLTTLETDADGAIDTTLTTLQGLLGWESGEMYLYAHQQGIYPEGRITTLPLGGLIGSRSRISHVLLQVVDSTGARVRVNDGTWEEHTTSTPESGIWRFRVEHAQDIEPRVEIETIEQRPLNIYQILVEVDVGGV